MMRLTIVFQSLISQSFSEVEWAVKQTGLTEAQLRKFKGKPTASAEMSAKNKTIKKGAAGKRKKSKLAKRKVAPRRKYKARCLAEKSQEDTENVPKEATGKVPKSRRPIKLKPQAAKRLRKMIALRSEARPSTEQVVLFNSSQINAQTI